MEVNKRRPDNFEIKVLKGEKEETAEIQRVLEEAPDYSRRITGYPPSPEDAESVFTALAPGKTYADKFVFGVYLNGNIIGFADTVRGYPDESTATIGLLLLSEKRQSNGFGVRAYQKVEEIIRTWENCNKIQIGVVKTNDIVLPFWEKMGYFETGGQKLYKNENINSEMIILEKSLGN